MSKTVKIYILSVILLAISAGFIWMGLKMETPKEVILAPSPTVIPTLAPFSAEKLMSIVNDWRQTQNLQLYTENETLCKIASERLVEVQSNWSHDGFVAKHNTYLPNTYMSENLGRGYDREEELLTSWLNSPSHAANLNKDYQYSCIKCDNNYCVQEFSSN